MSLIPAASTTARTAPPAITPRAWRGWLEQHLRGAELLHDLVRDGRAGHRHADQVLARALGALADRIGHLVGFAQADADVAGAIADDDHRAEREAAATFDDLGHAVDLDDLFLERDAASGPICSC